MLLSIVIPAHNEALRIARTLDDYTSQFSARNGFSAEIIVVINGSTDNTAGIVAEYSRRFDCVKTHFITGKGKGRAIRAGMMVASGDLLAFADADGATAAIELRKLLEHMGHHDAVIASRWLPQSAVSPRQTFSRLVASRAWNLLVRVFLGLPYRDTQCGAKIFTRAAVAMVIEELAVEGFAFDIELLYRLKLKDLRVAEVPISWNDQTRSTLSLVHCVPEMLRDLIRIRRSKALSQSHFS